MDVKQDNKSFSLVFESGRVVSDLSRREIEDLYRYAPVLAALAFPDDFADEFSGTGYQFVEKRERLE